MKTIELSRETNRWDELVTAYEAGETIELVDDGRPVARVEPERGTGIVWNPENPDAIWKKLQTFRDSLAGGGEPVAVRDIRDLRES